MMGRRVLAALLTVFAIVTAGCIGGGVSLEKTGTSKPWKPDGVIEPGEYSSNFTVGGDFSAFLRVDNGSLFVGMKAKTRGWVAVGFGGGPGMRKTDIIIAYVLPNGTVEISDSYSPGFAGPHNPDTTYGGVDNIISHGGGEEGDFTVVEFSRKLDTGDRYDFKIPTSGTFRVIWAYGTEDDFVSEHVKAGHFYVSLGGG